MSEIEFKPIRKAKCIPENEFTTHLRCGIIKKSSLCHVQNDSGENLVFILGDAGKVKLSISAAHQSKRSDQWNAVSDLYGSVF